MEPASAAVAPIAGTIGADSPPDLDRIRTRQEGDEMSRPAGGSSSKPKRAAQDKPWIAFPIEVEDDDISEAEEEDNTHPGPPDV